MRVSFALIAALILGLAMPGFVSLAAAQTVPPEAAAKAAAARPAAKARAKAKAKALPKNAAQAIISNAQASALTGMQITNSAGKVVASLKKALEPGKKITLKLPGKAGCLFTVNAAFADGSEFEPSEVDLCVDKNVRFTD